MTARFGYYFRQVTDQDAPLGYRVVALKRLVTSYDSLTWATAARLGYMEIWKRIGDALELGDTVGYASGVRVNRGARRLTGPEIDVAACLLRDQRTHFLAELRRFEAIRRTEKANGKRRPSRRQIADLYSHSWLVLPDP